jgi:hypothetical protein
MKCVLILSLAACASLAQNLPEIPAAAPQKVESDHKWKVVYFYDHADSEFVINDLKFTSPQRGIAVGFQVLKDNKVKPMAVRTSDGGVTWTDLPMKDPADSLFALDDNNYWVVSDKRLWYSSKAGLDWQKRKLPKDADRVYFLDVNRGYSVGAGKIVWQTDDGGVNWRPVPESEALPLTPEYCIFRWVEFVTPQVGLIVGQSQRPEGNAGQPPAWMEPERATRQRPRPSSTIMLETHDGGKTWKSQVASTFGSITRVRMRGALGTALFNYPDGLDWPSEVVMSDLTTGKNQPLFRRRNRNVTDLVLGRDGSIFMAAIEPPGRLVATPLPGKLHMIVSPDGEKWSEMDVDYRATGRRAVLSAAGDDLWVATDTGMILKWSPKQK